MRTEFVAFGPLATSARAWLEAGRPSGARPRTAATVMLLRDGAQGVEVFMMRRVPTMRFAPSMWVFPGGGVDIRDASPDVPWAGPSRADWAVRLGVPEDAAAELIVAAAREVFEECGVLLAGHRHLLSPGDRDPEPGGPESPGHGAVTDVSTIASQRDRDCLLDRTVSFGELLTDRGLQLRTDLLRLVDHWITPQFEPRRYDTWFFAARLPIGQEPDDVSTEADQVAWVRPAELLARAQAGEAVLFPPTRVQLERLSRAGDVDTMLRTRRTVGTVMPVAERRGDDILLVTELGDEPPGDRSADDPGVADPVDEYGTRR